MNKAINFTILGLFLVLSLGMISANTLVTGNVYNSDFSSAIDGASIVISCDSASLSTNSGNGTYAVIFSNNCTSVKIYASKDNLVGEENGIISPCTGTGCLTADYLSVVNPLLKAQVVTPSVSSGGGRGTGGSKVPYYLCGNGICDSGETIETCAKDCVVITENNDNQTSEAQPEETTPSRNGITGAVIGAVTSTGGIVILIVLVLLGASGFYFVRKKRLSKKE